MDADIPFRTVARSFECRMDDRFHRQPVARYQQGVDCADPATDCRVPCRYMSCSLIRTTPDVCILECITATNVSVEDQLTLSISVAVGSTIVWLTFCNLRFFAHTTTAQQTALFVIPFMVLLGWVLDKPLALLFDPFESIVLYISGMYIPPTAKCIHDAYSNATSTHDGIRRS